jgi:toxin CcdB
MARLDVYRNPETAQTRRIPFLLEVQSDLLAALNTTIVVPLYDPSAVNAPPIRGLRPTFEMEGQPVVMVTADLAGAARK